LTYAFSFIILAASTNKQNDDFLPTWLFYPTRMA